MAPPRSSRDAGDRVDWPHAGYAGWRVAAEGAGLVKGGAHDVILPPMDFPRTATARTPGSIGNFGPGLDILGCALAGPEDLVTATWVETTGITILDSGHPDLPLDATRHAAGIAARAVLDTILQQGVVPPAPGIALTVVKGLPLAGGQGGSGASAVAGASAVNALLGARLKTRDVFLSALQAETALSGRHLDNIAPSLLGGIVLVRSLDPIDVVPLPVPEHLMLVLAHPAQQLRTADARAVLPVQVSLEVALHQSAQVAAIVAALYAGDLELLGRAMDDRIAEPVRAPLLPGFAAAKRSAMEAGALGASISGAGPTAFALTGSREAAERVATAMRSAYEREGVQVAVRTCAVDRRGTVVTKDGDADG